MARFMVHRGSVKIGNSIRGAIFSFDPIASVEFDSAPPAGQQSVRVKIADGPNFVVEIPGDGQIVVVSGEKMIKDPTDPDGTTYMNAFSIVSRAKNREDGFRVIR